jgi:5,10-methylene-tetrahydrofolate dehydrogenase/methenyl tetrahydrofolate cyclohydrolase
MAVIIDGKQVSATIKEELREETARIKKQHDTVPLFSSSSIINFIS